MNITLVAGLRWHPLFVVRCSSGSLSRHGCAQLYISSRCRRPPPHPHRRCDHVHVHDCGLPIRLPVHDPKVCLWLHQVGTTNALAQLVQFSKRVNLVDVEFTLKAGGLLCSSWLEKLVATLERCRCDVVRSIRWYAKRRRRTRELEGL